MFGKALFAIDPDEKGPPSIADLDLAPRNTQRLVEFAATLDIIKPVGPSRGSRRILYEFSNRGNRGLMGFNYGRGADMSKPECAGDGFLMRQGYTLVWSGCPAEYYTFTYVAVPDHRSRSVTRATRPIPPP